MSRPTVDELRDQRRYRLRLALPHRDLGPFINTYYFLRRTPIIYLHYAFTTVLLIAWLLMGIEGRYSGGEWAAHFGLAALIFVGLVPLHEGLHALAYRLLGAREVRVEASLRRLTVVAIAPDFVIDSGGFTWVAITPFVVITVLLTLGMMVWEPARHLLLGVLVIHTGATSGDFALLSYVLMHRQRGLFSYDDGIDPVSYFYERIPPSEISPAP